MPALHDVEIPMRDGTILRATIHLPSPLPVGGVPALLTRTAYGKDTGLAIGSDLGALVDRGFAVVVQDKRGRFASDGEYALLRDDADGSHTHGGHSDGYDTVEWIAAQPWCDGRVGAFGLSYLGFAAMGAAIAAPPHLVAAVVEQPSSDEYTDRTFLDGAFCLQNVADWAALPLVAPDLIAKRPADEQPALEAELEVYRALGDARYAVLPLTDMPFLRLLPTAWAGPLGHREDEAYFAENRVDGGEAARVRVPVLHVGGWYDFFIRNSVRQYELLSRLSPAGDDNRLILGPWAHAQLANGTVAGVEYPDGAIHETSFVADWMTRWTDGRGAAGQPRAIVYVMGANRWRAEPSWPIVGTETRALALQPDGTAAFSAPVPGTRTFDYDPAAPYTAPSVIAGPIDATAHLGSHTLVYETATLDAPLEITGWPRAFLEAATTGTDADWLVELHVVGVDGAARMLNEGIARSRYRHGRPEPRATEPGAFERIEVHLRPLSIELQAGERLRVVVTGGKFPAFDRNPGAFVDLNTATEADFVPSVRTVASARIELPIVPAGVGGDWIENPWPIG
jgi:putative CocE/NonD family hydrolase